ncbi:hypothetical protein HG536_0E00810 [Torulaspora globosa]|uniref:Biogenesis of lysosome-related organelles complex 1 subunit CNL1 n=1 Tax=Torulaspora globosa TaxID=48254 RepID=A0A7G3ZI34_9SACH|nr:uncharacterized protein HG536_0E00810 [Torulaspora globosa]QLL33170.1 hypothetical protein HG536_0E00810 [Torulaspora globosa]
MSTSGNTSVPNEDPLGIDRLTIDYDYLLYKINDYVASIQLETTAICRRQNELIREQIIDQVMEKNIEGLNNILKKCEELENHFDMLDQIAVISENFKVRLARVLKDYKQLKS